MIIIIKAIIGFEISFWTGFFQIPQFDTAGGSLYSLAPAKQPGLETGDHPELRVQPVTRRGPPSVTRAKYRTDPGVDMLQEKSLSLFRKPFG